MPSAAATAPTSHLRFSSAVFEEVYAMPCHRQSVLTASTTQMCFSVAAIAATEASRGVWHLFSSDTGVPALASEGRAQLYTASTTGTAEHGSGLVPRAATLTYMSHMLAI